MTDTSGAAPVSIPPTVAGLIGSVFDSTTNNPGSSGSDEGKDESFFQEMGDKFRQSVDVVNSTAKLVGQTIAGATGQAQAASGAVAGAASQAQAGITAETAAKQQQDLLEGAARDKLVNDNLTVATAEGTTPQQMVERAQRINATTQTLQAENDELSKRAGTSIFDDPLSYIKNLFTTPFLQDKHDKDLESLKEDLSIQNQQQVASQDAAKVNAGIDAAHGADYTKSIMDQEAGIALQKKAQATIEAAKFESSNAAVIASTSDAEMNNAVKYSNVAGTAMNEARAGIELDATLGGKGARSAIYAQKAAAVANLDSNNKIASVVMGRGGAPITETEINSMPGNKKASFNDMKNSAIIGMQQGLNLSEVPLGSTPLDAANNKSNLGLKLANPAQEDVVKWIKSIETTTATQPLTDAKGNVLRSPSGQPINFKSLPIEDQNNIINNNILNNYGALYKNIPAANSVLSPGPMSSVLSAPMVSQTDLGKSLMPLAVNKLAPVDYDTIVASASKLIDSGMPIPVVAAQMKVMGQTMTAQVNAIRGISRMQLPQLGTDQFPSFNTVVHDSLGNAKPLDWNNQASIETFLTRNEIAKKTGPSPFLGLTGAPGLTGLPASQGF
jgi:hypothetical protein